MFERALHDSDMFTLIKMVFSMFGVYCACGCICAFSHLNYKTRSCVLGYPRWNLEGLGEVRFDKVRLAIAL
jgi:hypothetical protein